MNSLRTSGESSRSSFDLKLLRTSHSSGCGGGDGGFGVFALFFLRFHQLWPPAIFRRVKASAPAREAVESAANLGSGAVDHTLLKIAVGPAL